MDMDSEFKPKLVGDNELVWAIPLLYREHRRRFISGLEGLESCLSQIFWFSACRIFLDT